MLGTELRGGRAVTTTIAVKSLSIAKSFYEGVLGLSPTHSLQPAVVAYQIGTSPVLLYVAPHAGTNRATLATWNVGDGLDDIVDALRGRGVTFEHYSMRGTKLEGDVHVTGIRRVAWFKDPDGNILCLVNG